jgi:pyruvate/2-oxoglutarate dehydrogenase complex dihydrolipoamide dehydrogenase (E3) component
MTENPERPHELILPADEFNRALVENLHPSGWTNPTPKGRYNLVVVGAGVAGLVSAAGAAALGAKVALVEKHLMGGDCTNFGCVPSKALIRSARAAHALAEAPEFGVQVAGRADVDFPQVMQRMRRLRAQISVIDSASRFSGLGVDVYLGQARFTGKNEIEVAGAKLSFSKAVIATGSRAASLPIPGLAEAGFLTNETVFSLEQLPKTLLVIGSGPIGCELAQTFRRFGSAVTIITDVMGLLPNDDPDAGAIMKKCFEREGIGLVFGTKILRVEKSGVGKSLIFDRGQGEERLTAEEILVAAGRRPNLEGLGLEAAGVKTENNHVRVDDHLRTSNGDIFAAGDVCSIYKFTHAAEAMARIALQNALFFGRKRVSDLVIPWCTYTSPEVAHVGMTHRDAQKRASEIATFTRELAETDRSILDGETEGFVRIHVDKRKGRLMGATMVGAHAGESIGEAVLAIKQHLKVGDLSGVIHPYPTQAEALKRAADLQLRSRLSPRVRRIFEKFLSLRR